MTMDDGVLPPEPASAPKQNAQSLKKVTSFDKLTTPQPIISIYRAILDALDVLSVRKRNPQTL